MQQFPSIHISLQHQPQLFPVDIALRCCSINMQAVLSNGVRFAPESQILEQRGVIEQLNVRIASLEQELTNLQTAGKKSNRFPNLPYVIDEADPLRVELLQKLSDGYGRDAYRHRKDDPITAGMSAEQFLIHKWGRYFPKEKQVIYRHELVMQDFLLEKTLRRYVGARLSEIVPSKPGRQRLLKSLGF